MWCGLEEEAAPNPDLKKTHLRRRRMFYGQWEPLAPQVQSEIRNFGNNSSC